MFAEAQPRTRAKQICRKILDFLINIRILPFIWAASLFILPAWIIPGACAGEIITNFPTSAKAVALTFDGCETKTPSFLDRAITDFLVSHGIPATIFVSGKFALRNKEGLAELSKLDFIEIENHSLSHYQHMERLAGAEIEREVLENEKIILDITGRKPRFFRFPAGNFNDEALRTVETMGYQIAHWTFASGDPDKNETAQRLSRRVLSLTKPGSILIFHINGRGYHTGEALPRIVGELKTRGYELVKLSDILSEKALGSTLDRGSARDLPVGEGRR